MPGTAELTEAVHRLGAVGAAHTGGLPAIAGSTR